MNSCSQKIHSQKRFSAFHGIMFHFSSRSWIPVFTLFLVISAISWEITMKSTIFALKISIIEENCHSQISHFTQMVISEITFMHRGKHIFHRFIFVTAKQVETCMKIQKQNKGNLQRFLAEVWNLTWNQQKCQTSNLFLLNCKF